MRETLISPTDQLAAMIVGLNSAIDARKLKLKLGKLKKFDIRNAQCHDPEDREAILDLVSLHNVWPSCYPNPDPVPSLDCRMVQQQRPSP